MIKEISDVFKSLWYNGPVLAIVALLAATVALSAEFWLPGNLEFLLTALVFPVGVRAVFILYTLAMTDSDDYDPQDLPNFPNLWMIAANTVFWGAVIIYARQIGY